MALRLLGIAARGLRVGGNKTNHETGPGSTTVTWSFLVRPQGEDDHRDDFPCEHDD